MAEEEAEYESDPEETMMSLKLRRREASDDEEEEGENRREEPVRRIDDFDGESEGAAAEYEDDLEEEDYDLEEEFGGEEIEEEAECEAIIRARGEDSVVVVVDGAEAGREVIGGDVVEEAELKNEVREVNGDGIFGGGGDGEGKKEVEPYAVPTEGAFYMHDDRFRENSGRRNRRMLDGRKLWETRDNRKWGHDKFEEHSVHEKNYDEQRRGSRGRYRSRGKNKSTDRGYSQGYKPREHTTISSQKNIQNNASNSIRGRGSRRYQSFLKSNNEASFTHNNQKFDEKPSYASSVGMSESTSYAEHSVVLSRKQVFTSNLSIASPPFYPSGSSTKDSNVPHKREVQAGPINRNGQPHKVDESFTVAQSSAMLRGKNKVGSIGVNKLSIDDSVSSMARNSSNNVHVPVPSSSSINSAQRQMKGHGRGVGMTSLTQLAYRPVISNNQVDRDTAPSQPQTVSKNPDKNRAQSSMQSSGKQFTRVSNGSQASSAPNTVGFENGVTESSSESRKSKAAVVSKGNTNTQGSGSGSFLYGGASFTGSSGNMGNIHSDKNFPAFLPVMQFGGQHPGGMGVPAVGMAFPGYVGQPQLGLGNSEMTWLPVLAGATGALGASYCPPYISVDGSYHTRPSAPASTVPDASRTENNFKMVDNEWKPAQRLALANNDSGQRQKNSRRYTEMKFDQ